jgi:serine/threonine protein kinase
MLQAEQVLQGRYQLQKQLGNNAGRQTWLAVDLATQARERVIVKLLPFSPQLHWDDLKLFEREAQVLKHLNHPCIPKYRDYFSTEPSNSGELPWFGLVQDYIPGDCLQQLLNKGKRFTQAGVKEIAIQLLKILIYLHQLSPAVLHRDIKPSNIIWGKNRQVYLVDFGAVQEKAKAEGATFTVVGTGGYAPPEQLWGKAVPASDLYALGATLIHLLTGTAPADLPKRQMRLQFREQVSLTPSFAHWIETLTNPDPELRFSNARAALEALQASGSPSSSLLTAATGSQETNPKARQRTINIVVVQYVVLFLAAIALPSLFAKIWKAKQAEARQNVGAMNRAQKAYFLGHNEFTASVPKLGLGIGTPTKNYQYSIRATPLAVFNYATPREKKIKGYVGAVFLTSDLESKGEIVTVELVCETNSPVTKRPAEPIVQGNFVECPPNTKSLNTTTDNGTGRFVLGKDSALAYNSLNYAVAGQYDQALQVAKTIKHPHFKARALAAVAHQLAAKGQYDKALEVARTITGRSVKEIALKAIAVQLAAKGQYDKALEVAKTITDRSVKEIALKAIALQLAEKGRYDQALQVAETIENDSVKHRALDWIARYLAVAGRYDQALQVAETIKDDSAKQRALNAIAYQLAEKGQYERVLKIAATLADDFAKAQVMQAIAPNLSSAGQYDQALKIAKTIKDDSARASALQALNRSRKSP